MAVGRVGPDPVALDLARSKQAVNALQTQNWKNLGLLFTAGFFLGDFAFGGCSQNCD